MVDIAELVKAEKWEIKSVGGVRTILAYGQEFKWTHPVQIRLKLYRTETNPELKFQHMKAVHDYLWPDSIWHQWTEDRFREHCGLASYISWAGGASAAKSYDAAKIALIFWLANPKNRTVVVASTTLESVQARVWGYVCNLLSSMAVRLPFQYLGGQAPKILYPQDKTDKSELRDSIHGIFCVAAKSGDDDKVISNTIGRHPNEALLVVLDECSELSMALARAFPNLDSSEKPFQVIGIANSNSIHDLHGALSTPINGWNSINPLVDTRWETTRKNGICLFFSCYNSPAIHEADPKRKKILSRFLITEEQIKEKEILLGKDSDLFYRFVLGFWRSSATDTVVMSKQFLDGFNINDKAEWLGIKPLTRVAGLDPAFSTGGDKCILQIGVLGQTVEGGIVLDFRGNDLLFHIKIKASHGRDAESAELQIARQVCDLLQKYNVPLANLAIDANGQGRALGGTIYLEMATRVGQLQQPLKIYSTRGGTNVVNSFGMIIKSTLELWEDLRKYIEHNQIKGINPVAGAQLQHRQIIMDDKTKRQRLETKSDFKKRVGAVMPSLAHSPDEADAMAICLQSAIHTLGFSLGQRKEIPRVENHFVHEKLLATQAQATQMKQESTKGGTSGFTLEAGFTTTIEDFATMRRSF